MRNGRYEGKQRRPLVNTGPQWIMAGCPGQWTAVWMFLTLQATSQAARPGLLTAWHSEF